MNYKCFKCGADMDKSIESGHTVLKCSSCFNKWVSPTPSFMTGSGLNPKQQEENSNISKSTKIERDRAELFAFLDREDEFLRRLQNPLSSFQSPHTTRLKIDRSYLKPDEDLKTDEDKRRIQEEEGLSDEDMANGAWIDF